ncbi:hypothetical protein BGZ65_004694 [Modicella reniformis]|uniref:Uncharacterized protein n=1 Tax=Modicella reniformis TaxID=1440133 RepID=A0A9P6IL83_9FUNG|nr:hypothetical protein BGZ65_004694 [Modicella reniformis]
MGKSAKFFKRPTRKEKTVMSLTKGTTGSSLFDTATSQGLKGASTNKKESIFSTTANRTISKKSSSSSSSGSASAAAHPPKASLAYKMQLHGGVKLAVKDLKSLDNIDLPESDEDEDMEDDTPVHDNKNNNSTHNSSISTCGKKTKNEDLDKTKPRPDYVELIYGRPQTKNKRKTFMPKPTLIK